MPSIRNMREMTAELIKQYEEKSMIEVFIVVRGVDEPFVHKKVKTGEPFSVYAERLGRKGFEVEDGKWLTYYPPSSIVEIYTKS